MQRFAGTYEAAAQGALDAWAETPRGRLALIIVLDQFSRTLHAGTALAYAQDAKAIALADDGLRRRCYDALVTVWEKTFFILPLGHSERLADLDRCIALADALISEAPVQVRALYEFSASQARGHREMVARFGRQRIATLQSARRRPPKNWNTWRPAGSCIGAPSPVSPPPGLAALEKFLRPVGIPPPGSSLHQRVVLIPSTRAI